MSDMEASWGVNLADLSNGMTRIEAMMTRQAGGMDKEWGKAASGIQRSFFGIGNVGRASIYGVGAAIGIAIKATSDYAKINDDAQGVVTRLGRDGDRMWTDIGRAGTLAAAQIEGAWAGVSDTVGAFFKEYLNYDMSGNYTGGYDALKAGEMQKKAIASYTEGRRITEKMQADRLEKEGSFVDAAQIRGRARLEATMLDAQKRGVFGPDLEKVRNAIETQNEADVRDAKFRQDERTFKAREDNRQYENRRRDRLESLGTSAEQLRIDQIREGAKLPYDEANAMDAARVRGMERRANLLQIELDYRGRIRDIEKDELLTAEERKDRIQELLDLRKTDLETEVMRKDTYSEQKRSMSGGTLGGDRLMRSIFGFANAGGFNPANESRTQTELLRQIASNTRSQVAVMGP